MSAFSLMFSLKFKLSLLTIYTGRKVEFELYLIGITCISQMKGQM